MKVFLAADHAGFKLKNILLEHLPILGHDVVDLGPTEHDPDDDYPDYVAPLVEHVLGEEGSFGIICAGSGQGEAMAANRTKGIRAAVFYGPMPAHETLDREGGFSQDGYDAIRLSRRHNNANILSIGARFVSPAQADEAIRTFLSTPFADDERHHRRLGKF